MVTINKDITSISTGIICHQVNCRGAMGAGLARAIRARFPKVYEDYMRDFRRGELKLGHVIFSEIYKNPLLCVASLCGQYNYGRSGQYTNYKALEICFSKVVGYRNSNFSTAGGGIFIPYKLGCGLAGGQWPIVLHLIERIIPDAIICKPT